jgi:hypothetical protein
MKIDINNKLIKRAQEVFGKLAPKSDKQWEEWIEEIVDNHITSWEDMDE